MARETPALCGSLMSSRKDMEVYILGTPETDESTTSWAECSRQSRYASPIVPRLEKEVLLRQT
jgi:hypothetical protein